MSAAPASLGEWTANLSAREIAQADRALQRLQSKPRSAKRVHDARRALARLFATLQDFQSCIDDSQRLLDRVHDLHKRLGKIRDADVHLKRLRAYRENAAPEERRAILALRRATRKRRRKSRRKLAMLLNAARADLAQ